MRKNILLLESVADEAFHLLQQDAQVQVFTAYQGESIDEITSKHDIHAIITRGKGQVTDALMETCKGLEVVARCGVGLDNVDVKAATKRNIKVVNAPGVNAATIAEHTFSLMLILIRNLYNSISQVKEGNWQWRNQYTGDELSGKTLGVLGLGNIGKRVARMASVFGMNVVYWDKFVNEPAYTSLSMEEVLQQADVVTLHVPLLPDTEGLIGEKELALMQPHAMLINTARGSIIDQEALTKALQTGKIASFGADVLATEPPDENEPITKLPNTFISPHVGSLTATTYRNMCVLTVNNVLALLAGNEVEASCIFNRKELA